jgi:hypothetical protein
MAVLALLRNFAIWSANSSIAYSGDVNGGFQRDVDRRSGDVYKVGAQRRWTWNPA